MKLWDKGYSIDTAIENFTIGKDKELDLLLATHDILGNIAHVIMLEHVGLLSKEDLDALLPALRTLYKEAEAGNFVIEDGIEDIHSQVELLLTRQLGEVGKKVHTGRSRNDQVLVDLKLFTRAEIEKTMRLVERLFDVLQARSEETKALLMPGYTHLQVAMPSSFGLWLGAYAEALTDDMRLLVAAFEQANLNPLGSAAGYGSSAPLNRNMTTQLLGFYDLDYNAIYAQMNRGRMERTVAFAYSSVAETIGRLAMDCCMFNSQNFGFIKLPDTMTTGSSIMPHKKNPDVFELIRAHANRICALPDTIRHITTNLPVGYFRDMQLLKEVYFPLFDEMNSLLEITTYAIENMQMKADVMSNPLYMPAFSVEEVNRRVEQGVAFRDAYRQVADEITQGTFRHEATVEETLSHYTHEGSIGNLCNNEIKTKMDVITKNIHLEIIHQSIIDLLSKK
ncbi:MAG: argininosuccinate lyase [Paludibacteraceae bacterium]|nr:argininosuccinate lyase [Paludibacteraceae bacterium]